MGLGVQYYLTLRTAGSKKVDDLAKFAMENRIMGGDAQHHGAKCRAEVKTSQMAVVRRSQLAIAKSSICRCCVAVLGSNPDSKQVLWCHVDTTELRQYFATWESSHKAILKSSPPSVLLPTQILEYVW